MVADTLVYSIAYLCNPKWQLPVHGVSFAWLRAESVGSEERATPKKPLLLT
jgi:hypothetical protein